MMKAIDYLTEEERELRRSYYRKQKQKWIKPATAEETLAHNKYNYFCAMLNVSKFKYSRIKTEARRRNIAFDLTFVEYEQLVSFAKVCPIFGITLDYDMWSNNKQMRPAMASLDRLDNSLGYTKDNVVMLSCRANILKRDATLEELVMLGNWAQKEINKREQASVTTRTALSTNVDSSST